VDRAHGGVLSGLFHQAKVPQDAPARLTGGLHFAYRQLILPPPAVFDGNDPNALGRLGSVTASFSGDFDTGKELVDRAVALNPNASGAWGDRGWTYLVAGEPEEAIRSFERVIRLSPFDPWHFGNFTGMSIAFIDLGRFDNAVAMAKKALSQSRSFLTSHCCLVSALVHLGRETEARDVAIGLLKRKPDFCMSKWIASRSRWRTPIFSMASERQGFQGDANFCSQCTAELVENTATVASAVGNFYAGGFKQI